MSFPWLNSLESAFEPHAAHPQTTLERDQKKFWHAMQTEALDDMTEVIGKYGAQCLTWESKDGMPPLQTAQAWGCFQSFVQLVSLGLSTDVDYGQGWTPLLTALRDNDKFFIEYIIGNKPNLDAVATDNKGRTHTALQFAVDHGNIDAVRMLIERGANDKLEIEGKDGMKMLPADYARAKHEGKIAELLDLAPQVREIYEKQRVPFVPPAAAAPDAPAAPK